MKTITIRLSEPMAAEIEAESRQRGISKSDVVRERLKRAPKKAKIPPSLEAIADLIGSVEDLPSDLSSRTKYYLKKTGYGRNRADR